MKPIGAKKMDAEQKVINEADWRLKKRVRSKKIINEVDWRPKKRVGSKKGHQ